MKKIIKKSIIVLTMVLGLANSIYANSFAQDSAKAFKENDFETLKTLIPEWDKAEPENPEVQIAWFNYYLGRSSKSVAVEGQLPDGRYGIYDKIIFDDADVKLAIACLDKALVKHPERLDIHFGKCHSLLQSEHFEEGAQAIIDMIETSFKVNKKWTWSNGTPVDYDFEMAMFSGINDYFSMMYNSFQASKDAFGKVVAKVEKKYPKNNIGLNWAARYYSTTGNNKKAIDCLKKACELDKDDYIVLGNLGYLYELDNNFKEARKCYEKMIEMKNPEAQAYGKQYLEELGDK